MTQDQAIQVLVQVAHQALSAGVFKSFSDTDAVKQAIEAFIPKKEEESTEG